MYFGVIFLNFLSKFFLQESYEENEPKLLMSDMVTNSMSLLYPNLWLALIDEKIAEGSRNIFQVGISKSAFIP